MIREAILTRITWQQPGNAWKIAKTNDVLDGAPVSWKGPLGEGSDVGTWLRAEGEIETHPRFGHTFVVSKVLSSAEHTEPGIVTWIAMNLPDVGEVRAKAMLEIFGDSLPDVIETRHQELTRISGITSARAKKIRDEWMANPERRDIAISFLDTGMGPSIASRIAALNNIQSILATDPYELLAVDGISFEILDRALLRMGMDECDHRRIRGWTWGQLDDAAGSRGDCYLKLGDLAREIGRYCPKDKLPEVLAGGAHVVVRGDRAMLSRIDAAERAVVSKAQELLSEPSQEVLDAELPDWLDASQRKAALGLLSAPVAILTGGPGTGKTTTLKAALAAIEAQGEHMLLAAPTGKAAKRMGQVTQREAKTIHRMLEWSPEGFRRDAGNPLEARVVVVDEASMLDVELAAALFEAIAPGTRLILVGDVDQLPPVGPGQVLHDLMRSTHVPVFALTQVHRQAGESWVIDNARRIINGQTPDLSEKSDFDFASREDSDGIIDVIVHIYRTAEEREIPIMGMQVLAAEKRNGAGVNALNGAVQAALNPESQNTFAPHVNKIYKGDKVIFTKNNKDLGLVNGDMGMVIEIVEGRDNAALVKFENIENPDREDGLFELIADTARPLQLAYALTVHKSQGSEWPLVVVVADKAHRSLRRQLLYTAVTRTSRNLVIVGSKEAIGMAVRKPKDTNRMTSIVERLQA